MSRQFYSNNEVKLSVYNSKTLIIRLDNVEGEIDTGYICLPSAYFVDTHKEKFRFYAVLNYCADYGYEFGLWVYVFHPSFNDKIKGCTFRVIKGSNAFDLPLTISLNSMVGMYRSPCYEIVNNEGVLHVLIKFPNMTFETDVNVDTTPNNTQSEGNCTPTYDMRSAKLKKLKEVNLGGELTIAYLRVLSEAGYDVHFMVDGRKIGSFKFVLCAASDVFRAAFKRHTKESQTGEIVIEDFPWNIVQMFVDALHKHKIYFDDNPITTLNVGMFANKYNVRSIEKAALNSFDPIHVNRYNFVDVYRLAAYNDEIMDKLLHRFIQMQVDTKDIVDFEKLDDKTQVELLKSVHRKLIGGQKM